MPRDPHRPRRDVRLVAAFLLVALWLPILLLGALPAPLAHLLLLAALALFPWRELRRGP